MYWVNPWFFLSNKNLTNNDLNIILTEMKNKTNSIIFSDEEN